MRDQKSPGGLLGLVEDTVRCDACWLTANVADAVWDSRFAESIVETFATLICSTTLNFGVCKGFINSLAPVIIENVRDLTLEPGYLCSEIMTACKQKSYENLDPSDFISEVLSTKPESLADDNFLNALYDTISTDPN